MEYDWQKKYYGIIIVDFANQELAHKIYSINEKVKAFYFALTFFCLNISKLNTAAALAESKAFLKSLPYSTTIFCLEAAVMVELKLRLGINKNRIQKYSHRVLRHLFCGHKELEGYSFYNSLLILHPNPQNK